jgi:hypothetical protein
MIENPEVEKGKAFCVVEIIEYISQSVVIKTILKKTTGDITALACDDSGAFTEKIIPFDRFVQIIDGKAEIVIEGVPNFLDTGNSIIIPAHASNSVKPNQHFKMISTIIKSGYE